ncbi:unnamed protein product [Prorocentrum cordatum]|uniref:Uncharacterized protein n=1 Tax=Prorocentrum cordatum TaxID=2364126 RepID=A0ABN9UFS7_9DINO|nr:unnamed protein product [Polarella glacialis]
MRMRAFLALATFNASSLVGTRGQEVSAELRRAQIVARPRTKTPKHTASPHHTQQHEHHMAVHLGYGYRSPHVNNSAGCAILLGTRFKARYIKDITRPPQDICGRGGAITIEQGATKLKIIAAYSPPLLKKALQWRSTMNKDAKAKQESSRTQSRYTEGKAHKVLNKEAMALGLKEGHRREEFLTSLEGHLTSHAELLDAHLDKEDGTDHWGLTTQRFRDAAPEYFPADVERLQRCQAAREEKFRIYRQRAELHARRTQMEDPQAIEQEIEELDETIREISKMLKHHTKDTNCKYPELQCDDQWSAWRNRRLAECHRITEGGMREAAASRTAHTMDVNEVSFDDMSDREADDQDDTVGRELRLREGRQDEFMHLPKVVWALIADLVAMMLFIACIPFILTIAKRRRTTSQGAQAST